MRLIHQKKYHIMRYYIIHEFCENIGKIKNYDYEKKITKTAKFKIYLPAYKEHMKIR